MSSIPVVNVPLSVPHNFLNLPTSFSFNAGNSIELLYDGLGTKLRRTVKTAGSVTLTQDYLGGIELKNNVVEAVYNEEGRAYNNGGSYRYEYVLRDHLGNTRLVFTDKDGSGSIDNSEILSESHYYPFGRKMDGAWYSDASAGKYRYLYNGKELSDEFDLNFYDYGARWYDPGMGSWWQIDPLSEASRRWSPYVFSNNNPLRFIDPDGMQVIKDFNGNEHEIGENDVKTIYQAPQTQLDGVEQGDDNGDPPGKNKATRDPAQGGYSRTPGKREKNDLDGTLEVGVMFLQWAFGVGLESRGFLENSYESKAMSDAWRVQEAIAYYYSKPENLKAYRRTLRYGKNYLVGTGVSNYKGSFGIQGLFRAGFDPIEQFVGTYDIDIKSEDGKNLSILLINNTSMRSFLYGVSPSWRRNLWRPGGNMYQYYWLSVPIDNKKFFNK
ncbi:RHS repeat domain-containing protein [Spirosoma jeollabukense]